MGHGSWGSSHGIGSAGQDSATLHCSKYKGRLIQAEGEEKNGKRESARGEKGMREII